MVDSADTNADADADAANGGRVQKDLGGVSKDVMYRIKGLPWRADLCLRSFDQQPPTLVKRVYLPPLLTLTTAVV
jgi:hypothetical protein